MICKLITVRYIDHDGSECESRFEFEIDAIHYEAGLVAEGLFPERVEK